MSLGTTAPHMGDITELIHSACSGDAAALDTLYKSIYPDLRRIAHARLRGGLAQSDLDTTALVSEYFLRVQGAQRIDSPDRGRFFAYAARVMRSIIVDIVRFRASERRGGGAEHMTIDEALGHGTDDVAEAQIIRVHDAVDEIAVVDERLALSTPDYFSPITPE